MYKVSIVTLAAFNEIDSFLALNILNHTEAVTALLSGSQSQSVSMNAVTVSMAENLTQIAEADAVIIGSGRRSKEFAEDAEFLKELPLDPTRQLISSQCSGALILAAMGLLDGQPVCTDNASRRWIEERGLTVMDQSISVSGNIATAGGCLSAQYLATWILLRLVGETETRHALEYVAPVGESTAYIDNLVRVAMTADQTLTT